jgi:hypothetical protein
MAPICNRLDWRRTACKWLGYCRWSRPAAFEPVLPSGEAQSLAGTPQPIDMVKANSPSRNSGQHDGVDIGWINDRVPADPPIC